MKILLVQPDASLARGLRYYLQQAGYQVLVIPAVDALAEALKKESPDLVITASDTIEIAGARPLADEGDLARVPLIMPLPHLERAISGAAVGADATPPNPQRQLAEGIIARLRQVRRGRISRIRVGGLSLNFDRKRASFYGNPLPLTPLQFKLLSVLALNSKRVVEYRDLLEQVWGIEGDAGEARELLKVHINRIRQKLKTAAPEAPPHLHAARGFGYMLAGPRPAPKPAAGGTA